MSSVHKIFSLSKLSQGERQGAPIDRLPVCCRANTERQTTIQIHIQTYGQFKITI